MLRKFLLALTLFSILSTFMFPLKNHARGDSSTPGNESGSLPYSFDYELFKTIVNKQPGNNIFISPLSVSLALAMTANGAVGPTFDEMHRVLGLGQMSPERVNEYYKELAAVLPETDPRVVIKIANSIWYRLGMDFETSFLNLNREYYQAEIVGLDFALPESPDRINSWVREKTMDKIMEIVAGPIDPLTVMYLINAVYFKGTWTHQFDETQTRTLPFYTPGTTPADCRLMFQKNTFDYAENEHFQAADIPYGKESFVLTVILPREHTDINRLIALLNQDSLDRWLGEMSPQEGHVYLPRFKQEYEINLNEVLKKLGMITAFGAADFSKIRPQKDLFISEVKHKTFIEVNEEGTEAAAVTSVVLQRAAFMEPQLFTLRCDRPFIYLIREKDRGTVLFIGKLHRPNN